MELQRVQLEERCVVVFCLVGCCCFLRVLANWPIGLIFVMPAWLYLSLVCNIPILLLQECLVLNGILGIIKNIHQTQPVSEKMKRAVQTKCH